LTGDLNSSLGNPWGEDPDVIDARVSRREAALSNLATAGRMRRSGSIGDGSGGIRFATGRPRNPDFYWGRTALPFDIYDETGIGLQKLRDFCRNVSMTHPIVGPAIDIFCQYPLTGMELRCKDPALNDFYTELFFDDLSYEDFLVDVAREYWTVGEAFAFGSFSESLGVWEDDELLNPNDIRVTRSPFLREPRFEMRLPPVIRDLIRTREPLWEYEKLMEAYPELGHYSSTVYDDEGPVEQADNLMPVSNILLRHVYLKGSDPYLNRGIPILYRAIRTLIQEEMLNSAQEAIAERLYTPLILVKLGATASELGTNTPWVPSRGEMAAFEERMDAALAADFRMMVHHFGVNVESVFGREAMPRLNDDFDRMTERILQVFGLSKTMLSGAGSGQTYAADALNRDLITQLLTVFQRKLKRFFRDRALVVAEAQGHYDYETRGDRRVPIMQEVLEVDDEGNERIVEKPKLLVPELHMKVMNLRSEDQERQFVEQLRQSGIPVSMQTRMVNLPIDLEQEAEMVEDEQVDLAVRQQEVRRRTFEALRDRGLPIPEDLVRDFQPVAGEGGAPATRAPSPPRLGETPEQEAMGVGLSSEQGAEEMASDRLVRKLPSPSRPEESDEMRAGMPRAAKLDPAALRKDGSEDPDAGRIQRGPMGGAVREALPPMKG
jgi:hypothetical protein